MMPVARYQLDDGRIARFEVPEGTTPEQAQQIGQDYFASQQQPPQPEPQPVEAPQRLNLQGYQGPNSSVTGDPLRIRNPGVEQLAGAMLSGSVAEPVSGLAGLAAGPFVGKERAGDVVRDVRGALTSDIGPEGAALAQQAAGAIPQPVKDVFGAVVKKFTDFADSVAAKYGPAAGAAVKTAPTAVAQLGGLAAGKILLNASKNSGRVARTLSESAPTKENLKAAASALYKEIDDLGGTVKADAYKTLVDDIASVAQKSGLDKDITPAATRALARLAERVGDDVPVSELDTLRKVAQGAADSMNRTEKAIGNKIISAIDDFLNKADASTISGVAGDAAEIGKRFKLARELWGRSRRSELLNEAIETARNQASGFENGIRIQFRQILNNEKKRKFFTPDELDAIRRVVRGSSTENLARLIGRLGFSEGSATNMLGASVGAAGGAMIGGPSGAMAVPIFGTLSRQLAQRMTRGSASFADAVVRAGKDGRKIVSAYLRYTPRGARRADELAELLARPDIALQQLPRSALISDAVSLANQRRTALASGAASGAAANQTDQR